jgi:hypothetical protein
MPRFVLLYHDCPPSYARASHWDFMLESNDVLCTWALELLPRDWQAVHARTAGIYPDCPPLSSANQVSVERLGEHRRDYLQFEGPLSGDRGSVARMATGTYEKEVEMPDRWQVVMAGTELLGLVTLARSETDDSRWTLEYRRSP